MTKKYKKGSAWKRGHWDRWTFWKRVRHVIAVIIGLITAACMGIVFLILVSYLPDPLGWLKEIIINIMTD